MKVYRIKHAVRALLSTGTGFQLTELPAGSVFSTATLEPKENGMIEGTSNERKVLIFLNDLTEKSELMNIKIPPATVRIAPQASRS